MGAQNVETLVETQDLASLRGGGAPFDIVVDGQTPGDDPPAAAERVRPFAEAGATWWIETLWDERDPQKVHRRIAQGPRKSKYLSQNLF